jgi:hypothetical protein
MSSEIDHKQYLFGLHCKNGELTKAKLAYKEGAKLEAVFLGIAATFPNDLSVFRWLLEMNCPVDGNTWMYIAGSTNSMLRTKDIHEKTNCPLKVAGIHAVIDLDRPMLEYVVSQTGWLPEYRTNIQLKETYSELGQSKYEEFVKWVLSQTKQ